MARITAGTVARPSLPPGRSMVLPRRPVSRPASLVPPRRRCGGERAERLVPAPIRLDEPARLEARQGAAARRRRSSVVTATSSSTVVAPRSEPIGDALLGLVPPGEDGRRGRKLDPRLDRNRAIRITRLRDADEPRRAHQPEVVEQLRDTGHDPREPRPVAKEAVAAGGRRGIDRAGHEEALTALLERPGRRDERAAARPRLDDDDRVRRAADQPVALREGALGRLGPWRVLGDTAPPPSTMASASRSCARGKSAAWPPPMNATVGAPSVTHAAWAAPSIPMARPETTVAPARASAVAIRLAIRRPAGLGFRVPTTATTCSAASGASCRERTAPAAGSRSRRGATGSQGRPARRRGASNAPRPRESPSRRRRRLDDRVDATACGIARLAPSRSTLAATSCRSASACPATSRIAAGDPRPSTRRASVSGPMPWTESSTASASRSAVEIAARTAVP